MQFLRKVESYNLIILTLFLRFHVFHLWKDAKETTPNEKWPPYKVIFLSKLSWNTPEIPKFHFRPFSQKSYLELNFGTCSFFECSKNVKSIKNKIREKILEILEIRADFGSISVKMRIFEVKMWQNRAKCGENATKR